MMAPRRKIIDPAPTLLDQNLKRSTLERCCMPTECDPFLLIFFSSRFRPAVVKEFIHVVLREALGEKQYDCDEAKVWTREISDNLQTKLKGVFAA